MSIRLEKGDICEVISGTTILAELDQGCFLSLHDKNNSNGCASLVRPTDIKDILNIIEEMFTRILAAKYEKISLEFKLIVNSLSHEDKQTIFQSVKSTDVHIKSMLEGTGESYSIKFNTVDGGLLYKKHITSGEHSNHNDRFSFNNAENNLILIGASTGGTDAIESIISSFKAPIPPIVIAQHISKGFSAHFAERLNFHADGFKVMEADNGMELKHNHVYIAPGGFHLKLVKIGDDQIGCVITEDSTISEFSPSVDFLFNSVPVLPGKQMLAALLTGIGEDGAAGMLNLKEQRVHTIAQDESSSLVFGMPKAAIEMGSACEVAHIHNIPHAIVKSLNNIKSLKTG